MRLGKLRHRCTISEAYLTKQYFQLSELSEPRCKASCLAGAWTPVNLEAVVEKVQRDRREITPIMSWARRNNPFGGTLGRGEREPANTINNNLTPTAKSSPEGPGGAVLARRESSMEGGNSFSSAAYFIAGHKSWPPPTPQR